MNDGRPRFYVVATAGWEILAGGKRGNYGVSYAVLDRAYNYREVFRSYAGDTWLFRGRIRLGNVSADRRRARCHRVAASLNRRHEARMAAL